MSIEAIISLIIGGILSVASFLMRSSFVEMKQSLESLSKAITDIEKKNISLNDSLHHMVKDIADLQIQAKQNRASIDKIVLTMTSCENCRKVIDKRSLLE